MSYRKIREFEEHCKVAGLSQNTIDDRRELLMRVDHQVGELDGLTTVQISDWMFNQGWSNQTLKTYYYHLHQYFVWALAEGRISVDPTVEIALPTVSKHIARVAKILDYERVMSDAEHRWRIAATLARFAGLGAQEIANLLRSDISDEFIRIRGEKGDITERATHPLVWAVVQDLPVGHVVLSATNRPFTPAGISHAFGTRMRELGIADLTLNMLKNLYFLINRLDADAAALLTDPSAGSFFYNKNPQAFRQAIEDDVNAQDLIALAQRREQLRRFRRLLADPAYFHSERMQIGQVGRERVWQNFLEQNPWILGVTAGGQILSSWSGEKLEQTIRGASVSGSGKRVDALLRTTGRIRSLVFAEIKHHETMLLQTTVTPYRKDCWAISHELSGGIAQVQQTVDAAVHSIMDRRIPDLDGDGNELLGQFTYVVRPRSFLIAGTLDEFLGTDGGINRSKYHSFELFRRNLYEPEVLTFDELLARAEWHVSEAEEGRDRVAT